MHIFQLNSFPIEQIRDLDALERRLGGWFATLTYPVRLLALSRAFDMQPPITLIQRDQIALDQLRRVSMPLLQAIDAMDHDNAEPQSVVAQLDTPDMALLLELFAHLPDLQAALLGEPENSREAERDHWATIGNTLDALLWKLPWSKEMERFYRALQHRHVRRATFVLITWPPADVTPQSIQATLRHTTGRAVRILPSLPAALSGHYSEELRCLRPEHPANPYLAALLSYDMRGTWDATTLHGLLDTTYDVALVIDIQTFSRNRAMRSAEMAYNAARVVARDTQVLDVRAGRVMASAERVMHELAHEGLHSVQLGVLVGGATAEELEANVAETSSRLGSTLRLMRPIGVQGELLKLWSTTPRSAIDAPFKPRSMLSHGVGCCAGVLGYHRASRTDGVFWGLDGLRRAPLFFDLFANNQAAHTVVLGKSGYGKTFFLNLLALRSTALAHHRVITIDAFRNNERLLAAGQAGVHNHNLSLEYAINILDIVYADDDAEGDWRSPQHQHVSGQVALLLGTPAVNPQGKAYYVPRSLSIAERGVLDRALAVLYHDLGPATPLRDMPLLSDLINTLETQAVPEATSLARELRMLIYGTDDPDETELNSLGRCFNRPTAVEHDFAGDINCFDLSRVPEGLRPVFDLHVIGLILRFMRDPHRDRSRKTLLQIDEFGYLTQIEAFAQLAATICKVARKYGIGLMAIDQNPDTFLKSDNGRFIFENAVAKVLFHLDDAPANQLGEVMSDLTAAHLEFLSHAQVGECLSVVGNDVYVMTVEANPKELRALRGS